jgi:hypothetical protein
MSRAPLELDASDLRLHSNYRDSRLTNCYRPTCLGPFRSLKAFPALNDTRHDTYSYALRQIVHHKLAA